MVEEKKEQQQPQKLSYEELNKAAGELSMRVNFLTNQNNQLVKQVQELAQYAGFQRIEFLFKVLNYADKFPNDFVQSAVDELVDTLTIVKENKEDMGTDGK